MELPKITHKQLYILKLLYQFRFLNTHQVQRLLNHKSSRRIKEWLKDLYEKEYVERFYSRRIVENTKPAVYCLDKKSIRILRNRDDIDDWFIERIYREKTRSQTFKDHSMFLCEFYLKLLELPLKNRDKLMFQTHDEMYLNDAIIRPLPDAYIAIGEKEKYFLDVIDEGTPRFAMRSRIKKYCEYHDENTWQENTGTDFPKVLIICPNEMTLKFLKRFIKRTLEYEYAEINFLLATKEIVQTQKLSPSTWTKIQID